MLMKTPDKSKKNAEFTCAQGCREPGNDKQD